MHACMYVYIDEFQYVYVSGGMPLAYGATAEVIAATAPTHLTHIHTHTLAIEYQSMTILSTFCKAEEGKKTHEVIIPYRYTYVYIPC